MFSPEEMAEAAVECAQEGDRNGFSAFAQELEMAVGPNRAAQTLRSAGFTGIQTPGQAAVQATGDLNRQHAAVAD